MKAEFVITGSYSKLENVCAVTWFAFCEKSTIERRVELEQSLQQKC